MKPPKGLDLKHIPQGFILEMENKLKENDHKPHWRGDSSKELFEKLKGEIKELDSALFVLEARRAITGDDANYKHVGIAEAQREAADVANYAMMIWDVLEQEKEE